MSSDEATWSAVDDFINGALVPPDDALGAALRDSDAAGLPPISVTPARASCCSILARDPGRAADPRDRHARRLQHDLAGARAAAGRPLTLEIDPATAEVARANLARAGLDGVVEVRVGPALDGAARARARESPPPFDLVFIDADKANNPEYFARALELTRPGSLIVVDNVVRDGEILDERQRRAACAARARSSAHGSRAARDRDRDPDRGQQGLRRFRDRARPLNSPRLLLRRRPGRSRSCR